MDICRISALLLKLWKCTFYKLGAIVLFKWIYSYWQETLEYSLNHTHHSLSVFSLLWLFVTLRKSENTRITTWNGQVGAFLYLFLWRLNLCMYDKLKETYELFTIQSEFSLILLKYWATMQIIMKSNLFFYCLNSKACQSMTRSCCISHVCIHVLYMRIAFL